MVITTTILLALAAGASQVKLVKSQINIGPNQVKFERKVRDLSAVYNDTETLNCDEYLQPRYVGSLVDGFCIGPSSVPDGAVMAKYPPTTRLLNILRELLKRSPWNATGANFSGIVDGVHSSLAREEAPSSASTALLERWYDQSMVYGHPQYGRSLLQGLESVLMLAHPAISGFKYVSADFDMSTWTGWLGGGTLTVRSPLNIEYHLPVPDVPPLPAAIMACVLGVAKQACHLIPAYTHRVYKKLCTAARSAVICTETPIVMAVGDFDTIYEGYLGDIEAVHRATTTTTTSISPTTPSSAEALIVITICIILTTMSVVGVIAMMCFPQRVDACLGRLGWSRPVERCRDRLCGRRARRIDAETSLVAAGPAISCSRPA